MTAATVNTATVKAHFVGLEGDAVRLALLRAQAGEHFAADLEDVIVAPLDGERGALQRQ